MDQETRKPKFLPSGATQPGGYRHEQIDKHHAKEGEDQEENKGGKRIESDLEWGVRCYFDQGRILEGELFSQDLREGKETTAVNNSGCSPFFSKHVNTQFFSLNWNIPYLVSCKCL